MNCPATSSKLKITAKLPENVVLLLISITPELHQSYERSKYAPRLNVVFEEKFKSDVFSSEPFASSTSWYCQREIRVLVFNVAEL